MAKKYAKCTDFNDNLENWVWAIQRPSETSSDNHRFKSFTSILLYARFHTADTDMT